MVRVRALHLVCLIYNEITTRHTACTVLFALLIIYLSVHTSLSSTSLLIPFKSQAISKKAGKKTAAGGGGGDLPVGVGAAKGGKGGAGGKGGVARVSGSFLISMAAIVTTWRID